MEQSQPHPETTHTEAPYTDAPSAHVFIVTYGRSGSTLLQNLLNRFDGYCIRGENNATLSHLVRAWDAVERGESMRGARWRGVLMEPGNPWYGAELVDPDAYGRALAATFTREVLHPPAGTRVAGFKEIRHTSQSQVNLFPRQMEFMRRFFPDARFVFNTRDHDAVMRSGWWTKWTRTDPDAVRALLTRADALFSESAAAHPDCSLQLRYEDYDANPDGLRPLFEFLGEPFDQEMAGAVLARRLDHLKAKKERGVQC